MKRSLSLILSFIMVISMFVGCNKKPESTAEQGVTAEPVTLKVIGPWEDCTAIEVLEREFKDKYPNCTIEYEYLQNFNDNLMVRLQDNSEIDLFFTNGITSDSDLKQYTVDLKSAEGLDLSKTFEGLIENAATSEDGVSKMYAIPLGAEMRGLYVNKTLLNSLNIAVPTNQKTLLEACAKLKENGHIPFQANPGTFGQHLLYPWVCNLVANADNYEETYAKLEARGAGLSEMFREPYEFLYLLAENGYYDYKTVENKTGLFKDASDEAVARDFLNIKKQGEEYAFEAGTGQAAFMTGTLSLKSVIDKTKADYNSTVEYSFVPAPVGEDGGFVYLSPARSIAANKNSANLEWSIKFLDFLFMPENNETFCEVFHAIPKTKDAFNYISNLYTVPESRISQVGQVSFSSNFFYNPIKNALVAVSRANNPYSKNDDGTSKDMQADPNGKYVDKDGNRFSMYSLEHFMEKLDADLKGE